MTQSNRWSIFVSAVFLAAFLGVGWSTWPQSPKFQGSKGDLPQRDYVPGGKQCDPHLRGVVLEREKRLLQVDACAKEAEEYRLRATEVAQQERAADAAFAQTEIAFQQLWSGWWQTLGGLLTLGAAVAAAIFARSAALETKRSADIADDARRPWLTFDDYQVAVLNGPGGQDDIQQILISFGGRNVGQTPALGCRAAIYQSLRTPDFTVEDVLKEYEKGHDLQDLQTVSDAAPNGFFWMDVAPFSFNQIMDIAHGRLNYYVARVVTYDSCVGPKIRRTTENFVQITFDPGLSPYAMVQRMKCLHTGSISRMT